MKPNVSCPVCGKHKTKILKQTDTIETVTILRQCRNCKSIFEEQFKYEQTKLLEVNV